MTTFKNKFNHMCEGFRCPPLTLYVSEKTYSKINLRALSQNCIESEFPVLPTAYADYGTAKVVDFSCQNFSNHENNFIIVFMKNPFNHGD